MPADAPDCKPASGASRRGGYRSVWSIGSRARAFSERAPGGAVNQQGYSEAPGYRRPMTKPASTPHTMDAPQQASAVYASHRRISNGI